MTKYDDTVRWPRIQPSPQLASKHGKIGPFAVGDVLGGRFEICGTLGEGGMAVVYEARDLRLKRPVAIKVASPNSLHPLLLEAQALAAVRHSGVVVIHDIGEHLDIAYIVMERIYGISLEAHLERRRASGAPFALDEALEVLVPLAEALTAVHAAGIAHRDIKPANVMLSPGSRLVLMDLGIFLPEIEGWSDRTLAGTAEYMAPESTNGAIAAGHWHRVDLYAFGVVAFRVLAGEAPFLGASFAQTLRMHLEDPVPDLGALRRDLPSELVELVHALLAKAPEARPAMDEVLWRLRGFGSGGRGPLSVLTVDDDPDTTMLTSLLVRRAIPDAVVRTANSASEAIEKMRAAEPDLVLLDLDMPEINGIELCMYLRGTGIAPHAELVLVSSSAREQDLHLLRSLGVRYHVPKGPGMHAQLSGMLGEFSARHRIRRRGEMKGP